MINQELSKPQPFEGVQKLQVSLYQVMCSPSYPEGADYSERLPSLSYYITNLIFYPDNAQISRKISQQEFDSVMRIFFELSTYVGENKQDSKPSEIMNFCKLIAEKITDIK